MTDQRRPLYQVARDVLRSPTHVWLPDDVLQIVQAVAASTIVSIDAGMVFVDVEPREAKA